MHKDSNFQDFEKTVMTKLLDGPGNILLVLRQQYEKSTIKSREFSGTGFFTSFDVPNNVPKIEITKSFQIGDVFGQIDGVNDGVGFVLFVKGGILDFLEGYTYGDEKWPKKIINYQISYISGKERDMEKLRAKWD